MFKFILIRIRGYEILFNPLKNLKKLRTRKYKSLSFSADDEIEEMVNQRCATLGITRTGYILSLIREDLMRGGSLTLRESSTLILPPRVGKGRKRTSI